MGAGVRDAFLPPIVVWIVYAFRLGGLCAWAIGFVWLDCAWNGWWCLGKLRINGYFVCVGLRGKI